MPHLQMLLVVSGTAWSVHEAHVLAALPLAVHAHAHVGVTHKCCIVSTTSQAAYCAEGNTAAVEAAVEVSPRYYILA